MYVRSASHAAPNGSGWYEAIPDKLKAQLDTYFRKAEDQLWGRRGEVLQKRVRGVIAPHAGMAYSGETASYVYAVLRRYLYGSTHPADEIRRIFILGPSHVKGFEGVEISRASQLETPFGPLAVDTDLTAELLKRFKESKVPADWSSRVVDEKEHSIELQTPYLSHLLHYPPEGVPRAVDRVKMVPIVVGFTNEQMEKSISQVLEPYLSQVENVFVYSSDFCHWGERFRYTHHYKKEKYPQIGDAIIAMDHEAMDILEKVDKKAWYEYFDRTGNTICGRHAIGVGLQHWSQTKDKFSVDFLHYSQSNKCASKADSCVSYASAVITEA